ncbi:MULTISPECIES: hypothetical protein [Flavobacterium]|jgi:hypothetical protein|uniref:hypothetical protein n=1 Tax=Flavobacterium TaxID=237 RepID=UPI000BB31962|nr:MULTISPECIES: hypothetical protein [Flavobacterium]MCM0666592.1 hypothetical protein [Flavobacterium tyrosinilyticum]PBI85611.1 hypothetical protein BSF41_35880 [Flavobacterium sp. ACN2]
MKKLSIVFATIFIVSCSNDEKDEAISKFSTPSNLQGTYCYISGSTVFFDKDNNASCIAKPKSTLTFKYNSSLNATTIQWSIEAQPAGSIIVNGNTNQETISLTFKADFEKGSINSIGESEKGICGPTLFITNR